MRPVDEESLHAEEICAGQEELYRFAWRDGDAFGAAWIRFRLDRRQIDGAVVALSGRSPLFFTLIRADRMNRSVDRFRPQYGLPAGRLCAKMITPLKRWQISVLGADHAHLQWDRETRPLRGRATGDGDWHWLDQGGTIEGYTMFHKREFRWRGPAIRQHGWGIPPWRIKRDWQRWTVLLANGDLLSWQTDLYGSADVDLFIRQGRKCHRIPARVDIAAERTTIVADGLPRTVTLRRSCMLPWVREGSSGTLTWHETTDGGLAFCEAMRYTGRRGYVGQLPAIVRVLLRGGRETSS